MLRLIAAFLLAAASIDAAVHYVHGQVAYIVNRPQSALSRHVLADLTRYIMEVLAKPPVVVSSLARVPAGQAAIIIGVAGEPLPLQAMPPAGSGEAFAIASATVQGRQLIVISGASDRGVKRGVQRLVLRSRQVSGGLEFPDLNLAEKPWIAEREWALCGWAPKHVRGVFANPHADNRMNVFLYSDRQLADYASMYDWFGFSGVQLLETVYSYGVMGSPEAFQDRERKLARTAHQNGQTVSLWVWAAEFSRYNWVDRDMVYEPREGMTAFDDPRVRQGFEKYYNQYAQLAPDVDRLIGHFYDPGRLTNRQDVFQYMKLLEAKFRARNPRVQMAMDSWAAGPDYLDALVANGFGDYLLLEMSMPHLFKPGQRERLHEDANRLGLKLGVWGWYSTEYETDQLASMYVNAKILKQFYRQMQTGVDRTHPITYWSEMEAHHLNNIYSMYAAAQLLWNPDRDPDDILAEITYAIWGPKNGPAILDALQLIQDTRSGPNWETYWWTLPGYRLGDEDPERDLRRAHDAIRRLSRMETVAAFVPQIPLPFPPATLVQLMLPHLKQIRAFAEFRVELRNITERVARGLGGGDLAGELSRAWRPIPEYNTWIGVFGQPEARMQEILIRKVAGQAGVEVLEPAWVKARDASRVLQKIQNMQAGRPDELRVQAKDLKAEFAWTAEKLQDRLQLLISQGSVETIGPDTYRLPNWADLAAP